MSTSRKTCAKDQLIVTVETNRNRVPGLGGEKKVGIKL